MKAKSSEDRVSAALALIGSRKKWEARALLLDELRVSSDRRNEVLSILEKQFPLSRRQKKALDEITASNDSPPAALEVMVDAPDPRFTDVLVPRAEDDPKALEALLRVRERYAAEALAELYPDATGPVALAIERIHSGAGETPDVDLETPPPPPDVPEDRLWGLVDEVRRADLAIYGPSDGKRKSAGRKPSTKKKVRSARQ